MEKKKSKFGLLLALLFLIMCGLSPSVYAVDGWTFSAGTWTWGAVSAASPADGIDYLSKFDVSGSYLTNNAPASTHSFVIAATSPEFDGLTLTEIAGLEIGDFTVTMPTGIASITGNVITGTAAVTISATSIGGTLTTGAGALTASSLTSVGAVTAGGDITFGAATLASLNVTGTATIAGATKVTGNVITGTSAVTLSAITEIGGSLTTGAGELTATALTKVGAVTAGGNITFGTATLASLNVIADATINGTAITVTGDAATNSTLTLATPTTFGGNVNGSGTITFSGTITSVTTTAGKTISTPVIVPSGVTVTTLTNAGTITTLTNAGTITTLTNTDGTIDLLINNSTNNITVSDGTINNLIDASTGATTSTGVINSKYNATHYYNSGQYYNLDGTVITLAEICALAATEITTNNVGLAVMSQIPTDAFNQLANPPTAIPGFDFAQNAGNILYSIPSTVQTVGKIYNNKGAKNVALVFANSNVSLGAVNMANGSELTIKNQAGVGSKVTIRAGSPSVDIAGVGTILNLDTLSVTFNDLVSVTGSAQMNIRIGDYRNQVVFEAGTAIADYSILLGGGNVSNVIDKTAGTLNIVGTGQARDGSQPSVWIKGIATLDEVQLTTGTTTTKYQSDTIIGTLNIINSELQTDTTFGLIGGTADGTYKNGTLNLTGTDCNFNGVVGFAVTSADTLSVITDRNTSLKFMGATAQTTFPNCVTPRELFDLYFGGTAAATVKLNGDLHIYGDLLTNKVANSSLVTSVVHAITIDGAADLINLTVDGQFSDSLGTFTCTDTLNLVLNGTVLDSTHYPTNLTGTNVSVTFGGTRNTFAPLLPATVALKNLTVNNPQAEIKISGNLVINNNLNVTYGTLDANAKNITVEENTTVGPEGALKLTDSVSVTTAGASPTHKFGTDDDNTFVNNGLVDIRGRSVLNSNTQTNQATFEAIYSGTGAIYTNEWTGLIFNGAANLDIPATIKDLNSLTLAITDAFIATMNSDITIWKTTASSLTITSGTVKIAGRKLELLSIPAQTGVIDATGVGSTLEVTGAFAPTGKDDPVVYKNGNVLTDLNTVLKINNGTSNITSNAITDLKDLTIYSGTMYTGAKAIPAAGVTAVAASYTNPTSNELTIAGNLNIIAATDQAALFTGANGTTLNLNNVTLDGLTSTANAKADFTGSIVNITGSLNAGNDATIDIVTTTNATILNVLGTSEQFQLPASIIALDKLTLDRPSGLRLNLGDNSTTTPTLTLGITTATATVVALDIKKGLLDLNGYNITFGTANHTISEVPGAYVTNKGTSHFDNTSTSTKGAILSTASPTIDQAKSIGVLFKTGFVPTTSLTAAGSVRRYPKTVMVPEVGVGLKRYYYVSPTAITAGTNLLGFYYDRQELNGNEPSLRIFLEKVEAGKTTDAFSNAELLKGQTAVNSSTPNTLGYITVTKMESGATYTADDTLANASYIFALASTGGGGSDKVWTNGTGDDMWQTAGNWGPTPGAPGVLDQAIIARAGDTIIITNKATCGNLWVDGDDIVIQGGFVPGNTQDTAVLQVTGNINIEGASVINGQTLNLQIGDGQIQGVETQVFAPYTDDGFNQGIIVNNVTVNMATFKPSNGMHIKGNLELVANSTIEQTKGEDIVFYGVHSTPKTFKMSAASAASFGNIKLKNTAKLTTTAGFTVQDAVNMMDASSSFEATAGSIIFNQPNQRVWVNPGNANLIFNDVEIGCAIPTSLVTALSEPLGSATFRGTLLKTNASTLSPVSSPYTTGSNGEYAVYFDNPRGATKIENTSTEPDAADKLNFWNLVVKGSGTRTTTESNFNVKNYLQVRADASLIASSGTIAMNGPGEMVIENQSDHTLIFSNLDIEGRVISSTSWKIAGDMTVYNGAFNSMRQTAGTITITNSGMRRGFIDNSTAVLPSITVNKLLVDSTSIFVTGGTSPDNLTASFEIKNYAVNTGIESGLELQIGGKIDMPASGIIYFSTDGSVVDSSVKYIINNGESVDMTIGNIVINPGKANNKVRTASNFDIIGTSGDFTPGNFVVGGAGASFEATDGTVSFAAPSAAAVTQVIRSIAPASTQFNNLRADYNVTLNLFDNDEIFVAGDMIMDSIAKFVAGTPGSNKAIVNLNSHSKAQHLTGTTSQVPAFDFTYLQIDKVDANINDYVANPYTDDYGVVYVEKATKISPTGAVDPSALILTTGVLNLGDDTLMVGAEYITRHNGAIDGVTGTYVIETGHQGLKLEDALFIVGETPTLYNLVVNENHQATNNLTVNNDLTLNAIFTLAPANTAGVIEPKLLTLYGNLIQTSANGKLASGATDNTMSRLVLKGTGTVQGGLKNELFNGTNGAFSITVARGETLGGNLTMDASNLTIQTGVNTLMLNSNTLTLSAAESTANPVGITIISGNLTADINSIVKFNGLDIVPANVFAKSECGTLDLTGTPSPKQVEFLGDVKVNKSIITPVGDANFRIITGDNILTLADACIENFSSATRGNNGWIVGNLVRTVSNSGKVLYPIGSMDEYAPLQMRYANANSQPIMATVSGIDPTQNRGGNPKNSENYEWNINPVSGVVNDSLITEFGWTNDNGLVAGLTPSTSRNNTFAARWDGTEWIEYRNTLASYASSTVSTNILTPQSGKYPIANSEDVTGTWAVFVANNDNDQSKDSAIATNMNKVVVKTITPAPVVTGRTFKVTVGLEDPLGQPITPTNDVVVNFSFVNPNGGATFTSSNSVTISAGKNEASVQLQLTLDASNNKGIAFAQIMADANNYIPTVSDYFPLLPDAPMVQADSIEFSKITYTSAKATWRNHGAERVVIIAKAELLLTAEEMPVNATTYVPNAVYGAGTNVGNAMVLYDGPAANGAQSIEINGLLPNTKYYVYAFAYNGIKGAEHYKITAATRNPNVLETLKGNNDDITLGKNNDYQTSATVGTNAPIKGMIYSDGDVDCFNFMVTSAAPNVRVLLTDLPGNYTLELYDFTGRRIRRSTLIGNSDEAMVANDLPAGTFVVKVFAEDGSIWEKEGDEYNLLINTYTNEIFSVTPKP